MRMQAIQRRRKSPGKRGLGCRCSSDNEKKYPHQRNDEGLASEIQHRTGFLGSTSWAPVFCVARGRSLRPPSPRNHFLSGTDNRGVRGIRAQFWSEWPLREADNSERISREYREVSPIRDQGRLRVIFRKRNRCGGIWLI